MTVWFFQNGWLPLGFDHGIYAHLVNRIGQDGFLTHLPTYLHYQYEPFSGVFFYNLTAFIGRNYLYSWWYLFLYLLMGGSIFILGKNKKHYTLGAIFWTLLFFFSTPQYFNLFWSFGKQIFATFFLILFIKYQKKYLVASLFLMACISLHRLTGFLAIMLVWINFICLQNKKISLKSFCLLIPVFIGAIPYLLDNNFSFQIQPILRNKIENLFMLSGNYGTWLSKNNFLYFELPSIIILLFWCIQFLKQNTVKKLFTHPLTIIFLVIGAMVFFRFIAHSRLQSFFDLFLILILTKFLSEYIKTKWLLVLVIIQAILWLSFASQWHKPYISEYENTIIKNITQDMPKEVKIFSFTPGYNSWLKRYTAAEIYSPGSREKFKKISQDRNELCSHLQLLWGSIYIYIGEHEYIGSILKNPCLRTVHEWGNGSKLLNYSSK
jgi:hypothetical protein